MSPPQDTEAAFALLYKALARMPSNVDAMVGLAGTYLHVGKLEEALDWCARAAALESSQRIDRLRSSIGDAFVRRAQHEAIAGRMDHAMQTLSRAVDAVGSTAARLYRALFATATAWFEEARDLAPEPDSIRLSLPVWGATYVEATCAGLLAALLAPGNVPALARKRTVRLEVTTTAAGRAAFEAAPVIAALRRFATIDYFIIADAILAEAPPPDFLYWVMSAGHHASMERAHRAGSAISFFTADMLLSDGSLDAAQRLLDDGSQAVLVRALEVDRAKVVPPAWRPGEPLALAGQDLVDHGLAQLGLDAAEPFPDGCRVLTPSSFAVAGGHVAYGFHFLPLMISAELTRRPSVRDLLTVDTRIVRSALGDLAPAGRVKIVTDPAEIAIASTLSTARGQQKQDLPSINALGRWGASWCFEAADMAYFEWCFRHRVVFPFRGAAIAPPDARESAMVADIVAAFRQHAARRIAERKAAA